MKINSIYQPVHPDQLSKLVGPVATVTATTHEGDICQVQWPDLSEDTLVFTEARGWRFLTTGKRPCTP